MKLSKLFIGAAILALGTTAMGEVALLRKEKAEKIDMNDVLFNSIELHTAYYEVQGEAPSQKGKPFRFDFVCGIARQGMAVKPFPQMNYLKISRGASAAEYWVGPEGVLVCNPPFFPKNTKDLEPGEYVRICQAFSPSGKKGGALCKTDINGSPSVCLSLSKTGYWEEIDKQIENIKSLCSEVVEEGQKTDPYLKLHKGTSLFVDWIVQDELKRRQQAIDAVLTAFKSKEIVATP